MERSLMLGKWVEKSPYWESTPTITVKNKYEKQQQQQQPNIMPVFSFKLNALSLENSQKRKKMGGGLLEGISALLSLN